MKPWQFFLIYLGGVLVGVFLSYGYYLQFEKVYTYEVEYYYIKPPPGLPELTGYWRPILTYDIKGMNGCDYLTKMRENEYYLKVNSCKRFAKKD